MLAIKLWVLLQFLLLPPMAKQRHGKDGQILHIILVQIVKLEKGR